jgi:hypothetical protein
MAIVQISKIQQRRGLNQDLPALSSAELAWSIDTRQLYIGNGTAQEGAPTEGVTEILTQHSLTNFTNNFTSNFAALTGNVSGIISQLSYLGVPQQAALGSNSSGVFLNVTQPNALMKYTFQQGTSHRTGSFILNYYPNNGTVSFSEEYDSTGDTDLVFTANAGTGSANILYSTVTATTVTYTVEYLV